MKAFYPWDRWSDGAEHRLVEGVDFTNLAALRGAAHSQGLRRGGKYSIRQVNRGSHKAVILRFKRGPQSSSSPPPPPPRSSIQLSLELINKVLAVSHPDIHEGKRKLTAEEVFKSFSNMRDKILEQRKRENGR